MSGKEQNHAMFILICNIIRQPTWRNARYSDSPSLHYVHLLAERKSKKPKPSHLKPNCCTVLPRTQTAVHTGRDTGDGEHINIKDIMHIRDVSLSLQWQLPHPLLPNEILQYAGLETKSSGELTILVFFCRPTLCSGSLQGQRITSVRAKKRVRACGLG